MADVTGFESWSATAASNAPSGSTAIGSGLDDNLREIQAQVREWLATADTIASDSTTDLSTKGARFITVSGTTTITAFGTLSAGIEKVLIFSDALTLTHNGTSLILPTAANITTAAGDIASFVSLGSGNWRCTGYLRASGASLIAAQLSGLVAAAAANTINNADYAQVWQWKVTTGSKTGFKITESAASTGASSVLFGVETLAASTADAFGVKARADTNYQFLVTETGAVNITGAVGSSSAGRAVTITSGAGSANEVGGTVTIAGGAAGAGGANAGPVNITGGGACTFAVTTGSLAMSADDATISLDTNATGEIEIVTVSGSVDVGAATTLTLQAAHLRSSDSSGTPVLTSGAGTGASIAGSDWAFKITCTADADASIVVTFANEWAAAPLVFVSSSVSGRVIHVSSATDTATLASGTDFSNGEILSVFCISIAS